MRRQAGATLKLIADLRQCGGRIRFDNRSEHCAMVALELERASLPGHLPPPLTIEMVILLDYVNIP